MSYRLSVISYRIPCRGATLLDTLVGIALMLVVFVGITSVFTLSVDVVTNNKARTGAMALAQERVEYIRSLSYDNIGTVGGIPEGNLEQTEAEGFNGVQYTRRTLVRYFDDPKDGLDTDDVNGITADAKEIKVAVSWTSKGGTREIAYTSRVSPHGIEQAVPGGTLKILVVDANSLPVANADVSIYNDSVSPEVDVTVLSNESGEATFIGASAGAGYEITVSKSGYSAAQTYTAGAENPNPSPGHLTIEESNTTAQTFAIDLTSEKTVRTWKRIEEAEWYDYFDDTSKIATSSNATVSGGEVHLTGPDPYPSWGAVHSSYIAPVYLYAWKELSWVDTKPASTDIKYQLYYDNSGPILIPDSDLPNNSLGLTSPVDISGLSTSTYPALRIAAELTTTDASSTPAIGEWIILYDSGPEPLPNIDFTMRGEKQIGTTGGGLPIYKYEEDLDSGAGSAAVQDDLEWDTYHASVDGSSIGYDISESCEPQPKVLAPDSTTTTNLYFAPHTTHTLLVDVKNTSGELIEGASVRIYRTGYDETQETEVCGQTFFEGMDEGTISGGDAYSAEISATGYQTYTSADDVDISNTSRLSVVLNSL